MSWAAWGSPGRTSRTTICRRWWMPRWPTGVASTFWSTPPVTGRARVKLYKGNCDVVGRQSPCSLYDEDVATFEEDAVYDQGDATGFIKLNALRLRLQRQRREKT